MTEDTSTIHLELNNAAVPLVRSVARAASKDDAQPILCNINLEPRDEQGVRCPLVDAHSVVVWATDSYRLHTVTFDQRQETASSTRHGQVYSWVATHGTGRARLAVTEAGIKMLHAHATGTDHVVQLPAAVLGAVTGKGDKHPLHVELEPTDQAAVMHARYGSRTKEGIAQPDASPPVWQLWSTEPRPLVVHLNSDGHDRLARIARLARAMPKDPAGKVKQPPVHLFTDGNDALHARLESDGYFMDVMLPGSSTALPDATVVTFAPDYLADAFAHAGPTMSMIDTRKPAVFGDRDTCGVLLMPVRSDELPRAPRDASRLSI